MRRRPGCRHTPATPGAAAGRAAAGGVASVVAAGSGAVAGATNGGSGGNSSNTATPSAASAASRIGQYQRRARFAGGAGGVLAADAGRGAARGLRFLVMRGSGIRVVLIAVAVPARTVADAVRRSGKGGLGPATRQGAGLRNRGYDGCS